MVIFQVVGYKKSGKTTLVSSLIRQFKKDGFKVASLKHHGHGARLIACKEPTLTSMGKQELS